ncbi:MAG: O-antigen ligase family protein [Gammaproteobacteria bacterium]|nr:O-antigen ligase family protein [Gammaproteobacteria bacterium]
MSPGDTVVPAAQLSSALALIVLMIGQVLPDLRLMLDGVPLNTFLLVQTVLFALALPLSLPARRGIFIVIGLVLPLAVTLLWSRDVVWGASTLLDLTASAATGSLLLAFSLAHIGIHRTFRIWLLLLAALLVAAIAYKIQNGFFDREVNFLLNGPNVFARQMGLAALLSGFLLRGPLRWLGIVIFALAVLWTQSKGPLLFLLLVSLGTGWLRLGPKGRVVALIGLGCVVIPLSLLVDQLRDIEFFRRFFIAVTVFDSGLSGENYGSVGSRVLLFSTATQMIGENPFGIGLGSWMPLSGLFWAEYPHNFFLEVLLEGGLLLGTVAAVPYFAFLLSRNAMIVAMGTFLALCQQVSGGLADTRFWLVFACLGAVTSRWHLRFGERRNTATPRGPTA